jgi:mono/diheme cytochrome c family protein
MKVKLFVLAALFAAAMPATAADKNVGAAEFARNCAMCHGGDGKGRGWFAEFLKTAPPALTQLRRDYGGVFPFDRVYEIIDGRKQVRTHGSRDMPVWGSIYRETQDKGYNPYYGQSMADEGAVRTRILGLIEYLSGIQE